MGFLVSDKTKADAGYWAGRRVLGAIDAVVWPMVLLWALWAMPGEAGLFKPVAAAAIVWMALGRLHRAVCRNRRYWFTTWAVARVASFALVVWVAMSLTRG